MGVWLGVAFPSLERGVVGRFAVEEAEEEEEGRVGGGGTDPIPGFGSYLKRGVEPRGRHLFTRIEG